MNEATVQRNYKDTIFRMLFKDKENLLSLYNALNNTAYTDLSGLEITTLENAVYMNYKNDVSFVFEHELMLYEHQSTANPNMPLRDLFYVTSMLQKRISTRNLYSSKQVMIPSPRFVVFYNGTDYQLERQTLRLSDAVEKAVDQCIAEGILSDFLRQNRAEVIMLSIFEYDEELHFKTLRDEGYESGYAEGHESGFSEGREVGLEQGENRLNNLYAILIESGRLDDLKRATQDREYQEQLMDELLPEEGQNT